MESFEAYEAQNKFWEKYDRTVLSSEILEMKKIPEEELKNFEIEDDIYFKITNDGDFYAVKIGDNKKVSVLYATF